MRRPLLTFLLLAAPVLAAPGRARADEPAAATPPTASKTSKPSAASLLESAERRYAELDFFGAAEHAAAAIEAGGLSRDEVLRSYRLLGSTRAAIDDATGARAAFVTLLGADPTFVADPNLGPRVTAAFEEAKAFWAAQPSRPSLALSASFEAGRSGTIRVKARSPLGFFKKLRAAHRFRGAGAFVTKDLPPGDVSIPVEAPPRAATLEYYALGLDERGNVLAASGTEASPQALAVLGLPAPKPSRPAPRPAPKGSGSVFASPWFWGVVTVVVVGGATAGIVAASGTSPPSSALASPRLFCGPVACR